MNLDFDDLEADVHLAWVRDRLVDALSRLEADALHVMQLHVIEGWDLALVAESMGRTEGELTRLYRGALDTLRKLLGRAA